MGRLTRGMLMLCAFVLLNNAHAQVFDAVVAADDSGDYTSIQSALNGVRAKSSGRYLFYIRPGTYHEKLSIVRDGVSLIGAEAEEVIISWDDYSGDPEGHSTSSSYTVQVEGDGFYAENITFANTAGDVGQAVAVSCTGREQVFNHCRFIGFQDTYYARKGMQYLTNCYLEGATDFVFGEATAILETCEIHCLAGGQYITAPADTKLITQVNGEDFYHGLLFLNSQITAAPGVADHSYYLGRPWQRNASSVYIGCTYSAHIKPEGWSEWSNDNHLTGTFAEFQNVDTEGNLVDVSERVSWSSQLTAGQVADDYRLDYFLDGWDPLPIMSSLEVPKSLTQQAANQSILELHWSEVTGAIGYAILKNSKLYAFSESNAFLDSDAEEGALYQVKSISPSGVLSQASNAIKAPPFTVLHVGAPTYFQVQSGVLNVEERVDFQVYTLYGQLILEEHHTDRLTLSGLPSGVYILWMENTAGEVTVVKVAI